MKLYLHIGTNKTGSSFLQTLFARNKDLLVRNHIFFPSSASEKEMLSGKISPGNGQPLTDALFARDEKKVTDILRNAFSQAQKKNCDSVFISNEVLIRAFAQEPCLRMLVDIAKTIGYTEIKALGFFRDPISHALSLYQHRSKDGRHRDIRKWLETDYETMRIFQQFIAHIDKYPVDWTFRKYFKDSDKLAEATFVDWLKIEKPEIPQDDSVNPSLALSEIVIIQHFKDTMENAVPFLMNEFYKLSQEEKGNDLHLRNSRRNTLYQYLLPYRELIDSLNRMLPENEQLELKEPKGDVESKRHEEEIVLSNKQLAAVAKALESYEKSNKGLRYIVWEMKELGRKIKSRI